MSEASPACSTPLGSATSSTVAVVQGHQPAGGVPGEQRLGSTAGEVLRVGRGGDAGDLDLSRSLRRGGGLGAKRVRLWCGVLRVGGADDDAVDPNPGEDEQDDRGDGQGDVAAAQPRGAFSSRHTPRCTPPVAGRGGVRGRADARAVRPRRGRRGQRAGPGRTGWFPPPWRGSSRSVPRSAQRRALRRCSGSTSSPTRTRWR